MSVAQVVNPSAPADKSRKYALPERERRFLLARLPAGRTIVRTAQITDNYLLGTRLRIRHVVETADGSTTMLYKLTQKVPAADDGPGLITTIYLSQAEYDALVTLPARQLRKTRYSMPPLGVDVFDPPLHGLVVAEAEFPSDATLHAFVPPPFAVAEVTRDPRFAGGSLVTTERNELLRVLASFGISADG
jgi:CYTH domain-containing protein